MTAPATSPAAKPQAPLQTEFAELAAALNVDAEKLPAGASELKAKEILFVSRLVTHGRMAQAAIEAGYKEGNAGVTANKVLGRPEVQRFFSKCVGQLSANANEMVQRVYVRSVQAHAAADEAFQRMQQADKLIEDTQRRTVTTGGESASTSTSSEHVRAREIALRDWTRATAVADRVDNLLASMLGRLNLNVNVNGTVQHVTVSKTVMETFSSMRREVIKTRQQEGGN